ncbi:MAG: hypothetical protein PHO32_03210 [Candidatus Cloacimonetes bacterium]|nr:hypothetical protein [Candidatus Cloacimonadota bacterium]
MKRLLILMCLVYFIYIHLQAQESSFVGSELARKSPWSFGFQLGAGLSHILEEESKLDQWTTTPQIGYGVLVCYRIRPWLELQTELSEFKHRSRCLVIHPYPYSPEMQASIKDKMFRVPLTLKLLTPERFSLSNMYLGAGVYLDKPQTAVLSEKISYINSIVVQSRNIISDYPKLSYGFQVQLGNRLNVGSIEFRYNYEISDFKIEGLDTGSLRHNSYFFIYSIILSNFS